MQSLLEKVSFISQQEIALQFARLRNFTLRIENFDILSFDTLLTFNSKEFGKLLSLIMINPLMSFETNLREWNKAKSVKFDNYLENVILKFQ